MEDFLEPINSIHGVRARFVGRIEGVEVDTDRFATVTRLEPHHRAIVTDMGFSWDVCWRAEQVHGAEIAIVKGDDFVAAETIDGVDGLITKDASLLLGIYVADCGAIYLVDSKTGALGLLHSGKKGTELGILPKAINMMQEEFGTDPADLIVTLAPCIRPPAYDIDFAAEICQQAMDAGVKSENYHDCKICTGTHLKDYYSYRIEKGATGRMLALLGKVTQVGNE